MDNKIKQIIKDLESKKKLSYSSMELRNRNQLMNRLDRIQDRDLNKRISIQQEKLKKDKLFPKVDKETEDILEAFNISKKKKVQKNRGGFLSFVR